MAYNLINIMIFIIYLHAGNSSVVIHGVFRASQARPTYCHSSSQRAVRLQRAHLLACAGPFLGRGGGSGLVLSLFGSLLFLLLLHMSRGVPGLLL